jgi:hypothetical protein
MANFQISHLDLVPKDYNDTRMEYSTIQVDDFSLAVLPNCNASIKCNDLWVSALNNNTNIGCGINILVFMSEINDDNANIGLTQAAHSGEGTAFHYIVDWFNKKIQSINQNTSKIFVEKQRDISTIEGLSGFFNLMTYFLVPNSCTIVKLNRNENPNLRPYNSTPGHYVLLSKEYNGDIITYEPIYSRRGACNSRTYKGTVSPNFFKTFIEQGYISASLLGVVNNPLLNQDRYVGGNKISNGTFLIPESIMNTFINDIQHATKCHTKNGGYSRRYKNKHTRKHTRKKHKRRHYLKNKYKN